MKSWLTPSAERYVMDWGLTLALAGALCALFGLLCGWIIWRNTRKLTQSIEERNRTAQADYERTSDEISRIKSELAGGR